MIAGLAVVAVALFAISIWGWWVLPGLVAEEMDEEARERRAADLRRGVVAYFFVALLVLVLLAASWGHW